MIRGVHSGAAGGRVLEEADRVGRSPFLTHKSREPRQTGMKSRARSSWGPLSFGGRPEPAGGARRRLWEGHAVGVRAQTRVHGSEAPSLPLTPVLYKTSGDAVVFLASVKAFVNSYFGFSCPSVQSFIHLSISAFSQPPSCHLPSSHPPTHPSPCLPPSVHPWDSLYVTNNQMYVLCSLLCEISGLVWMASEALSNVTLCDSLN